MRTEVSAEIPAVQLERWLRRDIDLVEHILDGIEQESAEFREITAPRISVPEGQRDISGLQSYGKRRRNSASFPWTKESAYDNGVSPPRNRSVL